MSRKLELKRVSPKFAILKNVENIILRVSFQLSVAENERVIHFSNIFKIKRN